jgi:hypothetical protein
MNQIPSTLFINIEQENAFQMAATELLRSCVGVVCDYLINECLKTTETKSKKGNPFENDSRYFKLNRSSYQTANSSSTRCSLRRKMQ